MSEESDRVSGVLEGESTSSAEKATKGSSRRKFLKQVGVGAAGAAGILMMPSAVSAQSPGDGAAGALVPPALPPTINNSRIIKAFQLRVSEAINDALVPPAINVDNGDEARYPDKGGTYTKGLPHDNFGRVDLTAYATLQQALHSGKFSDFENIIVGGPRTLNGPQGGLTFDLEGLDSVQFGQPQVPPAPQVSNALTGTELIELYWASLLRDRAFTTYGTSSLAAQAAAELSAQPTYQGPRDSFGNVTPNLLFRGGFPGETKGPYISQFFILPTFFGAQPLDQKMLSYAPNIDFMTSFDDWLAVQNGFVPGATQDDPQFRYRRNGRDLAAYTRLDVLYQAYFTAFLILAGLGAPLNPGNPYIGSTSENGFDSLGGPDFAGTQGEIATRALHAVWYQKWMVHLRPRPEEVGGRLHLIKTGQGNKTDITLNNNILNSQALQRSFNKFGTYLLSTAFPEGSPTHPAYPTGHGTVGGACITLLKFFFDGNFVIPDPKVPTANGLSLEDYTGPDANQLTVNGELNKLAHNVTFGHGILAGIHWRSDSDTSMLLGEAVAIAWLEDRARTYNEPFSVTFTKLDGTTKTITNHGNP
jgi:hypothetical protein